MFKPAFFFCRCLFLFFFMFGSAVAEEVSLKTFWSSFRKSEPFLAQEIVVSERAEDGSRVIIVTEPPTTALADTDDWPKEIFGKQVLDVQIFKHQIGFDGWVKDIGLRVANLDDASLEMAVQRVHAQYYGSAYKAGWRIHEPKPWDRMKIMTRRLGPPNLEISTASLDHWLFKQAITFSSDPFSSSRTSIISNTLADLFQRNEISVVYSDAPGLVLLMLPRGEQLNRNLAALRRFFVDTDELLGAVMPRSGKILALVGRARTTSLRNMPPLRVETLLTLAATDVENLAQSYERNAVFAGTIMDSTLAALIQDGRLQDEIETKLNDLKRITSAPSANPILKAIIEGSAIESAVDWAPILLSRELTNTEYGQLLNITDQMLKSWSMANAIEYGAFPYPKTVSYPDPTGVVDWLSQALGEPVTELTFNWNTAGFGVWTEFGENNIFAIYRTGSLPVSYIPEGIELSEIKREKLTDAEDRYWRFFAELRDPYLMRVAQYAALHIIFQRFKVAADRSEPLVTEADYDERWHGLTHQTELALSIAAGLSLENADEPTSMFSTTTSCVYPVSNGLLADKDLRSKLRQRTSPSELALLLADPRKFAEKTAQTFDAEWATLRERGKRWEQERDRFHARVKNCQEAALECQSGQRPNRGKTGESDLEALCANPRYRAISPAIARYCDSLKRYEGGPFVYPGLDTDMFGQPTVCNLPNYCEVSSLKSEKQRLETQNYAIARKAESLNARAKRIEADREFAEGIRTQLNLYGDCQKAWRSIVDSAPVGNSAVHKTPSIVVSKNVDNSSYTGGHNIDGRALRIVPDESVAKGQVRVDTDSNILRVNPFELSKSQNLARTFERNRRSYLTGEARQRRAIEDKLRASLQKDTRPAVPFSAVALGKEPAVVTSTNTRTAGFEVKLLGKTEAKSLLKHANDNGGMLVIERIGENFQISFPGGKPPMMFRANTFHGRQQAMEAIVDHAAQQLSADINTVVVVGRGDALSVGDLASLRYSAEARADGGGNGGYKPPINLDQASPEPPRFPNFGLAFTRDSKIDGGVIHGGEGGRNFWGSGSGGGGRFGRGPRRSRPALFVVRKGDADLPFRRGNWAKAQVSSDSTGLGSRPVIKLEVPLETSTLTDGAPQTPFQRFAKIIFRPFFKKKSADRNHGDLLLKVIEEELQLAGNDPLIKKIIKIRSNYLRRVSEGGARLHTDVKYRDSDFFVVEKDMQGRTNDRG